MKRLLTIFIIMLLGCDSFAQTINQSPAYKECIALSSSNPVRALAKGDEWLAIDNGIAAHHCHAMALYGLRRYAEAGEALTNLRVAIPESDLTLRSFVTKQAVSAWINANRADAALAILDQQIGEMSQSRGNNALAARVAADLLLERARLNITYGRVNVAMQDLDHAVSLTPLNIDVLNERAQAFESMGDHSLARADAQSVLTLSPANQKARSLATKIDRGR